MKRNYEVRFCEGHGFSSDPEPLYFTAENDESALRWVSEEFEEPVEKLHEAGIEKIVRMENCKEITIWPTKKIVGNCYPNTIALCRERLLRRFPDADSCRETIPDISLCFLVGALNPVVQDRERTELAGYLVYELGEIPVIEDLERRSWHMAMVVTYCVALGVLKPGEAKSFVLIDVEQSKSGAS